MTLYDFGTNTTQKRLNMAAILKFKMAAEDAFEKNGTNSGFVRRGIRMQKNLGSTSIGNFALDYITPCTISRNKMWGAVDNYNHMCHICAKGFFESNFIIKQLLTKYQIFT